MKLDQKTVTGIMYPLIRENNSADEDKGRLIVAAIAKGVAYAMPLPSQQVVSVRSYYLDHAEAEVLAVISDLNEHVVFNARMAKELTYEIYRARYNLCHNPAAMDTHKLIDGLMANDPSCSLTPDWRGIFERVCADDTRAASFVARSLTETLTDTTSDGVPLGV